MSEMSDLSRALAVFRRYVEARNALLDELKLRRKSNRDPLAEFSEWLVATLIGGTRADNPVQKGWDVRGPDDEKVQVKYLANSTGQWINEHTIHVTEWVNSYALVIFEDLLPQAVVIFPARNLAAIGKALGKRHSDLDTTLQFTQTNYRRIRENMPQFKTLSVQLYLAPDWAVQ